MLSFFIYSVKRQKIKIPNINTTEFAEFYGIMLGDGCIYSNMSGICVAGHSVLDYMYHKNRLGLLIRILFGIEPKYYYSKDQKLIRTVVYSREVAKFFKELGFPVGLKKESTLVIPSIFFSNKNILKSCIRGLYDTDGTIYHHKGAKSIIEISITDLTLKEMTRKALELLGLNVKKTTKRVYLSGKEKTINFFNEILPANPRHTIKFSYLLKGEKIPSSIEIENYIKQGKFNSI
jgi:intein/homing endonuclease